jgi:hypothetical protein
MAHAIFNGPNQSTVIGNSPVNFPIASAIFAAGVAVDATETKFSFSNPGQYYVYVSFRAAVKDGVKSIAVSLYDNTAKLDVFILKGLASSTAKSDSQSFIFPVLVTNVAHLYSITLTGIGHGNDTVLISIAGFQALVTSFAPAADGITIINNPDGTISTSGASLPGIFPVGLYGAVGDGITNDTAAIAAATAAAVAHGGGIVLFDAKTYLTNTQTIPSNVVFQGLGTTLTTLLRTAAPPLGTSLILISGTSGQAVRSMTLNGNGAYGVYLFDAEDVQLRDLLATNCSLAFYVYFTNGCDIYNCRAVANPGYGFSEQGGSSDNKYTCCDAISCGTSGNAASFYFVGSEGDRFTSCGATDGAGHGFYFQNCLDIQGTEVKAERNAYDGFHFNACADCHFFNAYAHWNSSSDNIGTGKGVYSGFSIEGICADLNLRGRSGDRNDVALLNTPYQKYGIYENPGGTYTDCFYHLDIYDNVTGPSSLSGGNLVPLAGDGVTITTSSSGIISSAGGGSSVKGTATLVGGTVTVNAPTVAANSVILVSYNTTAGLIGFLSVPTASIMAGVSFVIHSSSATDASTVNWMIAS